MKHLKFMLITRITAYFSASPQGPENYISDMQHKILGL